MKKYQHLLLVALIVCTLQLTAQDKLLIAGSWNPTISILDKNSKEIEWKHRLQDGEECNMVSVTKEGYILYSYKNGAKLIDRSHHTIWDYKTSNDTELQSAIQLQNGGYLLAICGSPAKLVELDKTGKVKNEIKLDLKTENPHAQFRQVAQAQNGNYLLPVMSLQKVIEVDPKGKVVAELPVAVGAFSVLELKDGSLLLPAGDDHNFIVVNRQTGEKINEVGKAQMQDLTLHFIAQIVADSNENLFITNWDGHTKGTILNSPQIIELDKSGKVVWTLDDIEKVGKISTIHILKEADYLNLKK